MLYSYVWCLTFILVPVRLTTMCTSSHFNLKTLYLFLKIHLGHTFEPGNFFHQSMTVVLLQKQKIFFVAIFSGSIFMMWPFLKWNNYILRRAIPENGHPFYPHKWLSCYIAVEMFVTPGVCFHNFNLKICRLSFLLPVSNEFRFTPWIYHSSSDWKF